MIRKMHGMGMPSSAAYIAGFASIGAAVAAWSSSHWLEKAGIDRADRWGIFVGLWAPTFLSLGNALRFEEERERFQSGQVPNMSARRETVGSPRR